LDKAPDAFRTISEVADEINVPQHVLRFWESRFAQIRPLKRGGGRRYYRPQDVDLLRGVRHLLYGEGYTIRGVQRILREQGLSFVQGVWRAGAQPPPPESEEDRIDDADISTSVAERGEASLFGPPPSGAANNEFPPRREPVVPMPAAEERPLQGSTVDPERRRKLQAALDDLIGCRRVLEAALSETAAAED
jgi:DNA-binding transcriptional MerR regulator